MACQFLGRQICGQTRIATKSRPCIHGHQQTLLRMMTTGPKFGKLEQQGFFTVLPDVIRDVTSAPEFSDIKQVQQWRRKMMQYNLKDGRRNRGLTVVQVYQYLNKVSERTPEKMNLVRLIGWALEMMHASFLMNDDIMDDSEVRRQRSSWHKSSNTGIFAINDAVLLNASVFEFLRRNFKSQPYYSQVLELFHEAYLRCSLGSALDIRTTFLNQPLDLNKFTMATFSTIVKYKYAFYSFYVPMALAMHMSGIDKPELFRQAKTLCTEIGIYYGVEMDYLDCFGGPEVTWVQGSDIANGKCTWLVVTALQKASTEQRQLIQDHYAKKDPESVAVIKNLYEELKLKDQFRKYSEDQYYYLHRLAHQTSRGLPQEVFLKIMNRMFHTIND